MTKNGLFGSTKKMLAAMLFGILVTGCGGDGTTTTVNVTDNTVVSSGSAITPIDITATLTDSYNVDTSTKYYMAKLAPGESVTVMARSFEATSRVSLYFTDQYLVSSCVVGKLTSTAHSCSASTDESGYIYFSVSGGDTGTETTVDVLHLRDDMHLPSAPLDITGMLPYSSQSNIYVTQAYEIIDGDALYLHSLTPGQHYRISVESPDLKAVLKLSSSIGSDYTFADECPTIDSLKGISQCEYAANENGEIYIFVEPVFGATIALYTLSLEIVPDKYTGYYEGTATDPVLLDYNSDLPHTSGWIDTFSQGYYRIVGLTPFERYEALASYGTPTFGYSTIHAEGGLATPSRSLGTADENGTLAVDINVDIGVYTITMAPAPVNEGNVTDPILVVDANFSVQVADAYSWYQVIGLESNTSYDFAVTGKTNYDVVVNINYGTVFGYATDENFHSYDSDNEGKILIRVSGANTGGTGGRANIQWKKTGL